MKFIKAQVGPPNIGDPQSKFTVQYFDEQGNMTIRSGGTRAWRCNNPGNLIASSYSTGKSRCSIGRAGDTKNTYAVYPDYETGHQALVVMLKGSVYSPLSLAAAIQRYDSTNPKYIDDVVNITKLDPKRTIKSLDDEEFESLWKAVERIEGWTTGREDFIEKWVISGVHKKRGVITEYLITSNTQQWWLPKHEALACKERLHAVVVHRKTGTCYLRPKHGTPPFAIIRQKRLM